MSPTVLCGSRKNAKFGQPLVLSGGGSALSQLAAFLGQTSPSAIWWTPFIWDRNRREADNWRGSWAIAQDIDYHGSDGNHVSLEARDINSKVARAIAAKNPDVEVVAPTEALRLINDAGLADKWARFVEDFYSSGLPNKQYLAELGAVLHVDALVQGQIENIQQVDGDGWGVKGSTRITVAYSIIEIATAKQVWEAASDGIRTNAGSTGDAPPIVEAIMLAIERIIDNLPRL